MANKCVHHWLIDSQGIGRCRKCPAVRDFSRLLRAHGRGPVSLAKTEAAKKRWQDEEYREKQSAARRTPEPS
ncbi:unnamed protein product [marine sediment metagenome]|uniref:Uncharacterized protein n=1 Tax=marine sediment metagenome TaxID=412755 RepID=X1SCD0_9ZZZZ